MVARHFFYPYWFVLVCSAAMLGDFIEGHQGKLDSYPVESSLLYMLPRVVCCHVSRRRGVCADVLGTGRFVRLGALERVPTLLKVAEKSKYVRLRASILACIKVRRPKSATGCTMNSVHCARADVSPLLSLLRRRASYIFLLFRHFGRMALQEGRHRCYFDDFLCKQASLLFICGTFGCTAFGLWTAAG